MLPCPNCGEDNPTKARFCWSCGAALTAPLLSTDVRKTVTVVFCDIAGSTSLAEQIDPESLRRVLARYFDQMRAVVEAHGGVVEKLIGDAVMAVFGVPQVHEDDALRAVRATAEMRDKLVGLNRELERDWGVTLAVRTGVNTGEVVAGDASTGQPLVTGDVVNVAARLEQAAQLGETLIGEATYRLVKGVVSVEPLEPLQLKGKAEPVQAFRLTSVPAGLVPPALRLDSAMVGRQRERKLLEWAFDRAVEDRSCHLTTVLGAAGVGKSRLVLEFLGGIRTPSTVLRGRCLPYGEGITFWPVAELVRQAVGAPDSASPEETRNRVAAMLGSGPDAEGIAQRVGQVLGLAGPAAAAEETFWAVRKLLESLAQRGPLVVVFDDIHWGEPTFLDLVEYVADRSGDAPMLLVCMARPELLDRRPNWAGGKLNASTILLEPLRDSECQRLIDNLLGRTELTERARARITEAAEGNPLFVEEMISMLIDEGRLSRKDERWVPSEDLESVAVPPTIQTLLAARLDLLQPGERAVIERASVEGNVFHRGAILELCPPEVRGEVPGHLMALVRKELIRPVPPEFAGEEAFRFRHLLIRDAAYQSIAKETRAELHERIAAWQQRVAGDRALEFEEIMGYHLEQAHRYRGELGPLDEGGMELGLRAGEKLAEAGRRALGRGDASAAVKLFERAVALLPTDHPVRLEALPDLGMALRLVGDLKRAELVLAEAISLAQETQARRVEWHAIIERSFLWVLTNPEGSTEEARRWVEQAITVFEELEDDLGLVEAWRLRAATEFMLARAEAGSHALERAIHYARRADAIGQLGELFGLLLFFAVRGPMPVAQDLERTEKILQQAGQHRRLELPVLTHYAVLHSMLGEFEQARGLLDRAESIRVDLGLAPSPDTLTGRAAFFVEMLAGDAIEAERLLRREYDALERMGERSLLSTDAGYLAQALYVQGRIDEAERFARICKEAAASDDLSSQILWRTARAKVLARRGDFGQAESLAKEAVVITDRTDYVVMRADALMDQAEVMRLAGRHAEVLSILDEALRLYEAKGIIPAARHARTLLAEASAIVQG